MADDDLTYMPYPLDERHAQWPLDRVPESATIIRVGVWCKKDAAGEGGPDQLPVVVDEFVDLSSGDRLSLRWDRGFTVIGHGEGSISTTDLLEHLDMTLRPDEGESEDRHEDRSWHEYSRILALVGVSATPESLRQTSYSIEIDESLRGSR